MPSIILSWAVNTNSPEENSALFAGEFNVGGWDTNAKLNAGGFGVYGFFNFMPLHFNYNLDNLELVDGPINDQDVKQVVGVNV